MLSDVLGLGEVIDGPGHEIDHGLLVFLHQCLEGSTIPTEDASKRVMTFYRPRGVYAVVTPWNFPVNIPVEYIAPGLAAGNTIVWTPADKDFVLVNPSARASDGDIIAARIGTDATVKTLQHRGAMIVLEPANPDEREIVISPNDDFAVLGTIAAVFRPFHDLAEESDEAGAPPDA